jgi:hypothetical protein
MKRAQATKPLPRLEGPEIQRQARLIVQRTEPPQPAVQVDAHLVADPIAVAQRGLHVFTGGMSALRGLTIDKKFVVEEAELEWRWKPCPNPGSR